MILALLCDAYKEEQLEKDTRIVLALNKHIAPYQVAILPLSSKLVDNAKQEVWDLLAKDFELTFDSTASIGKRYRRQDAIGTPYCVTYDFDSINDHCVTIRDRDSMKQERIEISKLKEYLTNLFNS